MGIMKHGIKAGGLNTISWEVGKAKEKMESEKKSQIYQFEGQNEKRCWKRKLRRSDQWEVKKWGKLGLKWGKKVIKKEEVEDLSTHQELWE